MIKKKMIVTCALPYANGSLHIGHMLEHIQADIWVRYQRMRDNEVYFICGDDAHGTAIMLKSKQLNISPERMITQVQKEHNQDCQNFDISYDNYYSTHSKENQELLNQIYLLLKKNGFIKYKFVSQLYDPEKKMFLPDRFVQGTCPKCKDSKQYGDNCESCGATYTSMDLINPISIISGTLPVIRKSEHIFFNLPNFTEKLRIWLHTDVLQPEINNKIKEWFKLGLKKWCISRDAPYFGFKIPGSLNKYFYVWIDATIGYMGIFKNLCNKNKKISFQDFWDSNSKTELYHFIGKDIIYFHTLFWPAILDGIQFRKPTKIFVHGHVTINGSKMSKSKNTFINVNSYLLYLNSDYLRYYYATKLSSRINDIDLNLEDFSQKINSDIINKLLNLASRSSKFIYNNYYGKLSNILQDPTLYKYFVNTKSLIAQLFQNREFNEVTRTIMKLADKANHYINKKSPWHIDITNPENKLKILSIYSMGIQLFRILMIYLKPILPKIAKHSERFLNTNLTWSSIQQPLFNHKINKFQIKFYRISKDQMKFIIPKYPITHDDTHKNHHI